MLNLADIHSELHRLVLTHSLNDDHSVIQNLERDLGSPHRKTKIFKNPGIATHSELLIFSKHLAYEPTILFNEYGLGVDGLHPYEKELYPAAVSAA